MGNLKITLNHRKNKFSSHKTAYKVIEYHCVVTSCGVGEGGISKLLHQSTLKPYTENKKPRETHS